MNKQIKRFSATVIISFLMIGLVTTQVKADWASDYLDQMKNNANFKAASSIETQGSYGYSGGGFSYTYKNQTLQPFNVKAPSMSAGCGGISFDFGAFEFLSDPDSLVAFLESLLDAAPGYAFELGMQILCPSCIDIMNTMNQIANTLNGLQFDACGTMEALSGMASDAWNQYANSETGKGYRKYKEATEEYVVKPLSIFDNILQDTFDCIEGKGCPKPFFLGDKSLMSLIVDDMDDDTKQELKMFLGNINMSDETLAGFFRYLFGDVAFTKKKDGSVTGSGHDKEMEQGNSESHLVTYEPEIDATQIVSLLTYGDPKMISPATIESDNHKVGLFAISFVPENNGKGALFSRSDLADIDPYAFVAQNHLTNITNHFTNRTSLNDEQLLWLALFKSPVYKAFNMYSISKGALDSFSDNFKSVAGVQMAYEFLSKINMEILKGLAKFQQGVEMAGYWTDASRLPKKTEFIKNRLHTMVESSYSAYVEAYNIFSKKMQDNNELVKLQNIQNAMAARHPVLSQKIFVPGF